MTTVILHHELWGWLKVLAEAIYKQNNDSIIAFENFDPMSEDFLQKSTVESKF